MIGIIDYGAGNIKSVKNALISIGAACDTIDSGDEFDSFSGLILPGVGSFGAAMKQIHKMNLANPIKNWISLDKPFMGICLGLQLLFEESEESQGVKGLGVFEGIIKRIPAVGLKIPHIGWNSLGIIKNNGVFKDIKTNDFTYFVHSYCLDSKDKSIVAATCDYGTTIEAAVEKGNVSACQFHPEKSGETGLTILSRFLEICGEVK